MNKGFISTLFQPISTQWGLRGDPHLWKDLENFFVNIEFPQSAEDLEIALHEAVTQLIGQNLEADKNIFIEKYQQFGGMSAGMISSSFWLEKAIPLLKKRYEIAIKKGI